MQKRFLSVLSAEMLLEKIFFTIFEFTLSFVIEITELVTELLMINCNYLLLKINEAVVFINDGYIGNASKKNLSKLPNFTCRIESHGQRITRMQRELNLKLI